MGKIVYIQYKHLDRHSSPGLEGIPPVTKTDVMGPLASHLHHGRPRAMHIHYLASHIACINAKLRLPFVNIYRA